MITKYSISMRLDDNLLNGRGKVWLEARSEYGEGAGLIRNELLMALDVAQLRRLGEGALKLADVLETKGGPYIAWEHGKP